MKVRSYDTVRAKVMMSAKEIARTILPLLAVSVIAIPTPAQEVTPRPSPQFAQVGATKQGTTVSYQCTVATKDAGIEKTVIQATSEEAARLAATQKFGSRSTGLKGVSCAGTAGATAPADSSAQKEGVKTRQPTPTPFDPIRPGVEFLADGSCRLSQQAVADRRDARQYCQSAPASKGATFECPAKYCETLK